MVYSGIYNLHIVKHFVFTFSTPCLICSKSLLEDITFREDTWFLVCHSEKHPKRPNAAVQAVSLSDLFCQSSIRDDMYQVLSNINMPILTSKIQTVLHLDVCRNTSFLQRC